MKKEIRGALARGYCTDRNKHKVLDPDLLEDMIEPILAEMEKLIKESDIEEVDENILLANIRR